MLDNRGSSVHNLEKVRGRITLRMSIKALKIVSGQAVYVRRNLIRDKEEYT